MTRSRSHLLECRAEAIWLHGQLPHSISGEEEGGWQAGRLTEEIPQEQTGHNTRLRIPDSHQEKELGV